MTIIHRVSGYSTLLPLFLTSYINLEYLSQLMNQHWYIIISESTHFIQMFP